MKLVPAIDDGLRGILAHAGAAHFVDTAPGRRRNNALPNIGRSRRLKHRDGLLDDIRHHAGFVLSPLDIELHLGDAEAIDGRLRQPHAVVAVGQHFTESVEGGVPGAWHAQALFQAGPETAAVPGWAAARSALVAIAANEIQCGFRTRKVAEAGNVDAVGPAPVNDVLLELPVQGTVCAHREDMVDDVAPEYVMVVAKAVRHRLAG